jgi:methionyl aminopeptidase
MIPIKRGDDVKRMREACVVAATVLDRMAQIVEPGINTYDLDQYGRKVMEEMGAVSACYNYRAGSMVPYPSYTCLSVNDEIVHGIGKLERVLQEGDIVTVDVAIVYNGWVGDNARTVRVGKVAPEIDRLITCTEEAFQKGFNQARKGKRVGDISYAVQRYLDSNKLGIVREFVGHGVGRSMHEEPQIPNFGRKSTGPRLAAGMIFCIEPMVTLGNAATQVLSDGWTATTRDGSWSAHHEHTVLVTPDGPEILTIPESKLK